MKHTIPETRKKKHEINNNIDEIERTVEIQSGKPKN